MLSPFQAVFRISLTWNINPDLGHQHILQQASGTVPLTADSLTEVLKNKVWTKTLYPSGLLTLEHKIYQAIPDNVRFITTDCDVMFMTQEGGQPSAVSIGGAQPCNDSFGWRINVNYYGEPHTELVLHHVLRHYRHCLATGSTRSEYYIVLSLPERFLAFRKKEDLHSGLCKLWDVAQKAIEIMTAYHFDFRQDYLLPSTKVGAQVGKL